MLQNDKKLNNERHRLDIEICAKVVLAFDTRKGYDSCRKESVRLHRKTNPTSRTFPGEQKA